MNILTIVADSLRYDTYNLANTPNIDACFDVMEGYAQACFTYPAHQAIFQGFYPNCHVDRPLYNRFVMSLFRWHYIHTRPHIISLKGNSTIPRALQDIDYNTICIGGVGWFNKEFSLLSDGFNHFVYKPRLSQAIKQFNNIITSTKFYALVNLGITHRPYRSPNQSSEYRNAYSPKSGVDYNSTYNPKLHKKQVMCLEHLDNKLPDLLNIVKDHPHPTIVCFCADHGDCFGEDGCYGHAFYHPNVMRVPIAWSYFKDGIAMPITEELIKDIKSNG